MRTTNLVQDVTSPGGGGWSSPEQRELLDRVRAFTPEQRAAALAATRARFTPEDLAEIKRRQRESEKLLVRLAATETLEQQQRLADELCPRFDAWIRGRNRIMSVRRARTRPVRLVAVARPRARGAGRPRAQATRSSAASGDSGDDAGPPEPRVVLERWRWADSRSWRAFVESVQSRDFENEIARERMAGWSL